MVKIDDVKALGLKVGVIEEVMPHPNADRLYVLKVSLGEETRQLVAGIRAAYPNPDDLVGKRIVVITNLEPAVIRGVESQGMLLAAADGDRVSLITTLSDVAAGSEVR